MEDAIDSFRWINANGESVSGNDEAIDTMGYVPACGGVRYDMPSNEKPINDALVTVVLTIVAVFVCVWLLNTNKLNGKMKWSICWLLLIIFGLVIFSITRINDAYVSKHPPLNDPELELAVKGVNEQLPLQIANGIVMKNLELKDSAVVSTMEIDEKKYPFEDFLQNKELKSV